MTKSEKEGDDLLRQLFKLKLPIMFDPAPTEDDATPSSRAVPGRESGKQIESPAAETEP